MAGWRLSFGLPEGSGRLFGDTASGIKGWDLKQISATELRMTFNDGVDVSQPTCGAAGLTSGAWYHVIIYWDFDDTGTEGWRCYLQGVLAGTPTNLLSIDSMEDTGAFSVGDRSGGDDPYAGAIALVRVWQGLPEKTSAEWLAEAARRFEDIGGYRQEDTMPTPDPTTRTRSGIAYLDKFEGSDRKLYEVGDHWIPTVERDDANGRRVTGLLRESAGTNLFLRSNEFQTGWTTINASVGVNASSDPLGTQTADTIIADGTSGEHGLSQAVTMTAVRHVYSVWADPDNMPCVYLEDATATNVSAYFDTTTCTAGTTGANVIQAIAESDWLGTRCRVGISYVGTAASHTLRVLACESDGDKIFTGDAATANTSLFCAQLEVGDYPSSCIESAGTQGTRSLADLVYDGANVPVGQGSVVCSGVASDVDHDTANGDDVSRTIDYVYAATAATDQIRVQNNLTDDKIRISYEKDNAGVVDISRILGLGRLKRLSRMGLIMTSQRTGRRLRIVGGEMECSTGPQQQ